MIRLVRGLVLVLLGLPLLAVASVFNPVTDSQFNFSGDTVLRFESFTINEGFTVDFIAPPSSRIEVISQGDILINGVLKLPEQTTLTLNASWGMVSILGTIYSEGLHLKGQEGQIDLDHGSLINPGWIQARG